MRIQYTIRNGFQYVFFLHFLPPYISRLYAVPALYRNWQRARAFLPAYLTCLQEASAPKALLRKKGKGKEAAIKAARFVNFANSIDFLEKIRLSEKKNIHIRNEKTKQ